MLVYKSYVVEIMGASLAAIAVVSIVRRFNHRLCFKTIWLYILYLYENIMRKQHTSIFSFIVCKVNIRGRQFVHPRNLGEVNAPDVTIGCILHTLMMRFSTLPDENIWRSTICLMLSLTMFADYFLMWRWLVWSHIAIPIGFRKWQLICSDSKHLTC